MRMRAYAYLLSRLSCWVLGSAIRSERAWHTWARPLWGIPCTVAQTGCMLALRCTQTRFACLAHRSAPRCPRTLGPFLRLHNLVPKTINITESDESREQTVAFRVLRPREATDPTTRQGLCGLHGLNPRRHCRGSSPQGSTSGTCGQMCWGTGECASARAAQRTAHIKQTASEWCSASMHRHC